MGNASDEKRKELYFQMLSCVWYVLSPPLALVLWPHEK